MSVNGKVTCGACQNITRFSDHLYLETKIESNEETCNILFTCTQISTYMHVCMYTHDHVHVSFTHK